MRFIVMFVAAVCVLFLIKLRWPKKQNISTHLRVGRVNSELSIKNSHGQLDPPTRDDTTKKINMRSSFWL